jgi:rhamnose transport system ATP-binding protein
MLRSPISPVSSPLLQLDRVEKSFAGTRALKPLSLELAAGEVLGLIGENGAGKSTLIKILSGVHAPDAGTIQWRGDMVRFQSPHAAMKAGIATIHQELAYCGHLTVAENLLLGEQWPRHGWRGVNWIALHQRARAQLARFDLDIDTRRAMAELSAAQKQEVAIVRALHRRAQLLILDEPSASLSEPEVERLFTHLQRLRSEGVAILYVSHRLDEILKLTDRVVVLRDGESVAAYPTVEADLRRMVRDMVGRPLEQVYPRTRHSGLPDSRREEAQFERSEIRNPKSEGEQGLLAPAARPCRGKPLLELEHVSRSGMFRDINLTVHSGEIVGLAGLVGAGRSELARAIYGLYRCDLDEIRLHGRPWRPNGPHASVKAGLVYLPEERKRQSLVLDHSVGDSISIGFSDLLTRWGLIPRGAERSRVRAAMKTYDVRAGSVVQSIGTLSGGNQQKAVLARWLERDPSVIILDEPTRGVDVGAKMEIHALIDRLASRGCAVLLISSDLPEVLGMSDRVLVMHRGSIAAELRGAAMTQENVLLAASGFAPIHN